jgi:hypothetical protein
MSNNNTTNIMVAALGTAVTGILLYNSLQNSNEKIENYKTQPTPEWRTLNSIYTNDKNFPTMSMRGPPGYNEDVVDKSIEFKNISEQEDTPTEEEDDLKTFSKTHYGALEKERQAYQSWDRILNTDDDLLLNVFRGGKTKIDANIVATGSMHTGAYHRQLELDELEKERTEDDKKNPLRPTVGKLPKRFHYEPSGTDLFDVATTATGSNVQEQIKSEIKEGKKHRSFGAAASVLFNIRKQNIKE